MKEKTVTYSQFSRETPLWFLNYPVTMIIGLLLYYNGASGFIPAYLTIYGGVPCFLLVLALILDFIENIPKSQRIDWWNNNK